MKKKTFVAAAVAVLLVALGGVPAAAQDKAADTMQILIEKVRADKKLLVAANMDLSESEARAFWPLYQQYQDELFLIRAHTARLIQDYASAYKDMTDEKAAALLDESMRIEGLGLELRKAFLPKFREILPARKAARYYQIENKVQAALYNELAIQIPLVQ